MPRSQKESKMRTVISITAVLGSIFLQQVNTLAADPLDPTKYGNLKQSDVLSCPNDACGPAAAVNSFVFLQNMYPNIYDHKLVGVNGIDSVGYHFLQLAGDTLATSAYMGTCCTSGTPIEKFIIGKEQYIQDVAPITTTFKAVIDIPWRPEIAGTMQNPIAKPSWVTDSTEPSVSFLIGEINAGEDVELFLHYTSGKTGDHYVTLFRIDSPVNGIGDLNFIDPITGEPPDTEPVYEIKRSGFTSFLEVTYGDPNNPDNIITAIVADSVSESPIPEPPTWLLLATGLAGVLGYGWRQRKKAVYASATGIPAGPCHQILSTSDPTLRRKAILRVAFTTLDNEGTSSFKCSSRLPTISVAKVENLVMFSPGRPNWPRVLRRPGRR